MKKKSKITLKNIYYYLQGNIRYKIFYAKKGFWSCFKLKKHIAKQIASRINSMDRECWATGQCKICECQTTQLQMCNKACDKPCYPAMLSKYEWEVLIKTGVTLDGEWALKNNKFIKINRYGE
jgi:hypothetical protein